MLIATRTVLQVDAHRECRQLGVDPVVLGKKSIIFEQTVTYSSTQNDQDLLLLPWLLLLVSHVFSYQREGRSRSGISTSGCDNQERGGGCPTTATATSDYKLC